MCAIQTKNEKGRSRVGKEGSDEKRGRVIGGRRQQRGRRLLLSISDKNTTGGGGGDWWRWQEAGMTPWVRFPVYLNSDFRPLCWSRTEIRNQKWKMEDTIKSNTHTSSMCVHVRVFNQQEGVRSQCRGWPKFFDFYTGTALRSDFMIGTTHNPKDHLIDRCKNQFLLFSVIWFFFEDIELLDSTDMYAYGCLQYEIRDRRRLHVQSIATNTRTPLLPAVVVVEYDDDDDFFSEELKDAVYLPNGARK